MMFTDNTVICSESKVQVEHSLERWRYPLLRRCLKVSRSKTEYKNDTLNLGWAAPCAFHFHIFKNTHDSQMTHKQV